MTTYFKKNTTAGTYRKVWWVPLVGREKEKIQRGKYYRFVKRGKNNVVENNRFTNNQVQTSLNLQFAGKWENSHFHRKSNFTVLLVCPVCWHQFWAVWHPEAKLQVFRNLLITAPPARRAQPLSEQLQAKTWKTSTSQGFQGNKYQWDKGMMNHELSSYSHIKMIIISKWKQRNILNDLKVIKGL